MELIHCSTDPSLLQYSITASSTKSIIHQDRNLSGYLSARPNKRQGWTFSSECWSGSCAFESVPDHQLYWTDRFFEVDFAKLDHWIFSISLKIYSIRLGKATYQSLFNIEEAILPLLAWSITIRMVESIEIQFAIASEANMSHWIGKIQFILVSKLVVFPRMIRFHDGNLPHFVSVEAK